MKHTYICDIGKQRETNQDSVLARSRGDAGLFVVADGMGGYENGEKASQLIVQSLADWWEGFCPEYYHYDFRRMLHAVKAVIEQANETIFKQYNMAGTCGSTVAVLFIYEDIYGIIYAGDSRVYLYKGRKCRQLTIDEVWENQPSLSLLEKRMNWNNNHGKLLNAIGIFKEVQCRSMTDQLEKKMVFLLCSDGLYKYCPEKYLKKCMKQAGKHKDLETAGHWLLDKVYQGEAKDNISIVLVRI